jgi:alkanesulfonate monooxygenase SsuD/methylene tetrahydromethanopterin reductase-like flavin-dependent oxidoreductase (luciferase family)
MPRWGVHFIPSSGIGPLLEACAELDRAGVGEMSMSDEAFSVEPMVAMAAIAARHPSLRVGVRVTNPYVRHPLTLARETRAIADIAPAGVVLGLGVGGAMSLNATGTMARRRIKGLVETVGAVRRLLAGERVQLDTPDFFLDGQLEGSPAPSGRVRIEMTGRGPNMLAAAATTGDAVLVVGASIDEGARTIATIREAARAAGRDAPAITWSTYAVTDDAMLQDITPYMAYGLAEPTTIDRGVPAATIATIREVLHRDGRDAAGRLVPRSYVAERATLGTPDECRRRLSDWADEQGIATVLLRIPEGPRRQQWIEAACSVAAVRSAAPAG